MLSLLGVKGGGRHCLYLIPQLENRTTGRGEKCALREGGEAWSLFNTCLKIQRN